MAGIVVIGDLMLDVFQEGEVHRISPEAPVPILRNPRTRQVLGGAANTAANILALGHESRLVGPVGPDAYAKIIRDLAIRSGLTVRAVEVADYVTTTKMRLLSGGHQLLRVDEEMDVPGHGKDATLQAALRDVRESDSVVLSDYDKGALSGDAIRAIIAEAGGKPVVVDTKRRDIEAFRGCRVIAPNHHEAEMITGHADPRAAARSIAERIAGAVLVTLGADGMLLFENDSFTHLPSDAVDVSDVTGAGDTVTAALAAALSEGATLVQAARWANRAAAQVVARHGTVTADRARFPEWTEA